MATSIRNPYVVLLAVVAMSWGTSPSFPADRIVLRDLSIIGDRNVQGVDEDGLQLDDGRLITWDRVEQVAIADEQRNAAALRLLDELGQPLYRIRQRVSVGDDRGALEYAEQLYPRYRDRDSATAYLVVQALMWGRLAADKREAALGPYFWCLAYLRRHPDQPPLPGGRRLAFDPKTGLTPELPPIWFDAEASREAIADVSKMGARMPRPRPPGMYVYLATLAIAADQPKLAEQALRAVPSSDPLMAQWRRLIAAQQAVLTEAGNEALQELAGDATEWDPAGRPFVDYWLGRACLLDPKRRETGMLYLLRVPALNGNEQPELAGAALYWVWQALVDDGKTLKGVAVRRELLDHYGQTHFAREMRSVAATASDR